MNNFISVDIETTSDELRGSIVSIAMVNYETREDIYRIVDLSEGFFGKPAAFLVNGFTMTDLANNKISAPSEVIDQELTRFIPFGSIAMGRGISYFDLGFIRKDFPEASGQFHRRLFDLWGFIYGLSMIWGMEPSAIFDKAQRYAAQKIKELNKDLENFKPHHALYDAWENVFVLEYLKQFTVKL